MKKQKLLEEIFNSPESTGLRQASLDAGLHALRGKRKRRIVVRSSALVLGLMAVSVALFFQRNVSPRQAVVVTTSLKVIQKEISPPKVEIIDADKLLALFPNRSVALIGSHGRQRLIFLDETVAASR